jgi:hypothetical protein
MQLASAARRKHFNLMDSNFTAIEAEAMNEANTKQATVYIYIYIYIYHFLLQKLVMRCPNKPICASSSLAHFIMPTKICAHW